MPQAQLCFSPKIHFYIKFGLPEKHTKFKKIFLMATKTEKVYRTYICISKAVTIDAKVTKKPKIYTNTYLHASVKFCSVEVLPD